MFGWNENDEYVLPILSESPIHEIGVRQAYNVLGEERLSDMATLQVTGIRNVTNADKKPVAYYDFNGRRLSKPVSPCIIKYSDGSVGKFIKH